MNQILIVVAVALTIGLIIFGITVLVTGDDAGLVPAEPDGRAIPLPAERPLREADLSEITFDVTLRGYRMAQVDAALRRAAYDVGYKEELIRVLQAEVDALREGRMPEAEALRRAREAAVAAVQPPAPEVEAIAPDGGDAPEPAGPGADRPPGTQPAGAEPAESQGTETHGAESHGEASLAGGPDAGDRRG